jgi:SAM-dependent methyltransferase
VDESRRRWLAERRAAVVADYDAGASTYDDDSYAVPLHRSFAQRLADRCPPGGVILDAPCGTGQYFSIVTDGGRQVVGIDQSAGMLAQARARGLATKVEEVGLQEMTFSANFDGAMTIDAMENIPPEDWPLVLANLHRALRPGGHLYMTIEEIDQAEIDTAFADAQRLGWPAVHGEVVEGDTAGYHYYPGRERVMSWFAELELTLVDEAVSDHDGWSYRHFLLRRDGSGS